MELTPALTIQRKRDGKELTAKQIKDFIQGIATGDVTDYQATAFLMATFFKGMTLDETVALTEAMLASGERYDLSLIPGMKVDKHSTGGVGDKVSLLLAPLAAACGLKVPMMAGRGLGHTGGTLDKLEAIPGYQVKLSRTVFEKTLSDFGCAIIGQSDTMVPADKKLYALRDVTATVECIPLIVSSILSKKLAEGATGIIHDIKVGNGAFMKTRDQARRLAKIMIQVGDKMGLKSRALLTDMSQPLGCTAGNAIEVAECIAVLRGSKKYLDHYLHCTDSTSESCTTELKELTIQLCAHMLDIGGIVKSIAEGRKLAHAKLADGSAWKKFEELVVAQGGSLESIRHPEKLVKASHKIVWTAKKRGFLSKINTETVGRILVELGGGRNKATDTVDAGVGMKFHKKLGSSLKAGDPLVTVWANPKSENILHALENRFQDAIEISAIRKTVPRLVLEVVTSSKKKN